MLYWLPWWWYQWPRGWAFLPRDTGKNARQNFAFLTLLTLIRFFFGVSFYVAFQGTEKWEAFLTLLTLIHFLFGVSSDVLREVAFMWKTFLTLLTLVCGFSLVWVLMCAVRVNCLEKHFWQYSHWYGFSLVWVLMWHLRVPRSLWKTFLTLPHTGMVSLWCEFWCGLKALICLQNTFGNTHTDTVSLWCEFWCEHLGSFLLKQQISGKTWYTSSNAC